MFIRTFGQNKHFIAYVDVKDGKKLYIGVSAAEHPIISQKYTNTANLNSQHTVTANSTNYFSINEVPDFSDPKQIYEEDGLYYTACQLKTKIIRKQGLKRCVTACPTDLRYTENNICGKYCLDFVTPTDHMLTCLEKGECVSSCDSSKFRLTGYSLKYSNGIAKKYCLDVCHYSYSYIETDSSGIKYCKIACPASKEFISNISNINTANESGTCETNCPNNTYLLHKQLSNDTSSKKRCLPACNFAPYILIYEFGSTKICVEDCYYPRKYKSEDNNECLGSCPIFHVLSDVAHIESHSHTGECSSTCSAFQNTSPLGSSTKYCLPSCLSNQSHFYSLGSGKACSVECPGHTFRQVEQGNIPSTLEQVQAATLEKECSDTCSDYKLVVDSGSKYCLPTCPTGYYTKTVSAADKICLEECDITSTFKYSTLLSECTENCPQNAQFIHSEANKLTCLHSCLPSFPYFRTVSNLKHCVSACNQGEYLKLESLELGTDDSGSECVSECSTAVLETNTEFTSNSLPKQYCLLSCPGGMYTEITESGTKCVSTCTKLATPDMKCVDDCLNAEFPYQIGTDSCSSECSSLIDRNIYCVEQCPSERPVSLNRHCLSKCPSDKPFVLDFTVCTDKCPFKRDGEYCVSTCGDLSLLQYFSDKEINREYKPFTLSTGECDSECREDNFLLSHENTLECLHECPTEGSKYKNKDNVCRKECKDPLYPLKDSILGECVSECSENTPMITSDLECVSNCPPTHPIIDSETACSSEKCESGCLKFKKYCTEECNPTKFKLTENGVTKCVCTCPLGYRAGTDNTCLFKCESSEGFAKDSGQRCINCMKEQNTFVSGEYCVQQCPLGTAPSLKGQCVTCFKLGLWVNEQGTCLRQDECHPLSQKDQDRKTCLNCLGEGLMMLIRETEQPVCVTTNCDNGTIRQESSVFYCYECSEGRFFFNGFCNDICPHQLDYEMLRRTCAHSCHSKCTNTCCKHGRCKDNRCECNDQFIGSRCAIPVFLSETTVSRSITFLKGRMSVRLLAFNEILVIDEITLSLGNIIQRNLTQIEDSTAFLKNALSLVKKLFTPFSFQIPLFHILDRLLGLASKIDILAKNSTISLVKDTIDILTDQIFPESNSEHALNTIRFTGKFLKITASLRISSQNTVDLTECLNKLNLLNWQFPFKLLEFSSTLNISSESTESLLISASPLTEIHVFSPSKKINLPEICSGKDIDSVFKVELSAIEKSLAQKFSSTPFNLFDETDPFFVDRCVPFSEEGRDVTLSERKEMLLDPKKLCNETNMQVCTVVREGEDFNCNCKGVRQAKKSSLQTILASYPETNFILFTCHKVFKQANLTLNHGFYAVGLPFIFALLLALRCSLRINKDLESDSKFEYLREDGTVFKQASMSKDAYFAECLDLELKIKEIYFIRNLDADTIKSVSLPTIGDLRHLSAEELFIYDTRPAFQHAIDTFKQLHPTLKALFKKSLRTVPTFELLLLATETNLTSAMSAFFIQDSMVQRLNKQGEPSILDAVSKDLIQTVWTVLTSTLIIGLIKGFIVVDNKRADVLTNVILKNKQNPRRIYDRRVTARRTSLILFLFCSVLVNLILIYFVVIYTEIYANSQLLWLNGIIASLVVKHLIVRSIVPTFLVFSRATVRVVPNAFVLFRFAVYLSRKIDPAE